MSRAGYKRTTNKRINQHLDKLMASIRRFEKSQAKNAKPKAK